MSPIPAAESDAPVTFEELRARLGQTDPLLVNVLTEEAFESGRIPGSVSLPLADLPEKARDVLPDPFREIVVYCGSFT
jgi:rhodanese-related sulfurtransferase